LDFSVSRRREPPGIECASIEQRVRSIQLEMGRIKSGVRTAHLRVCGKPDTIGIMNKCRRLSEERGA
jgi:hypothetical protein